MKIIVAALRLLHLVWLQEWNAETHSWQYDSWSGRD